MRIVLLASALLALVLGGAALAAGPRAQAHATDGTLSGSVGPGFTISMSTARVAPGAYEITISDTSDLHNFHLVGPGVDLATSIEGTGKTTWNVTLQAGTYRFRCDAHAAQMTGQLVVGSDSTTTAPTPKPLRARIASVHATRKLVSVKVAAARRARAAATLRLRGKLVAHASGRVPGTLKLRPARALRGRYALRVVVTAGTTRTTLNRTIRIR